MFLSELIYELSNEFGSASALKCHYLAILSENLALWLNVQFKPLSWPSADELFLFLQHHGGIFKSRVFSPIPAYCSVSGCRVLIPASLLSYDTAPFGPSH